MLGQKERFIKPDEMADAKAAYAHGGDNVPPAFWKNAQGRTGNYCSPSNQSRSDRILTKVRPQPNQNRRRESV